MVNNTGPDHLKWVYCPECGKALFQVEQNAMVKGILIKCRGCRRIVKINKIEP